MTDGCIDALNLTCLAWLRVPYHSPKLLGAAQTMYANVMGTQIELRMLPPDSQVIVAIMCDLRAQNRANACWEAVQV